MRFVKGFVFLVLLFGSIGCASGEAERASSASAPTGSQSEPQQLVDRAVGTVNNFAADPDMTWFRNNVGRAKGIMIVPTLLRAGFVFGGSGGNGVFLAHDQATNTWSYPAFYTLGSVTFGLQAGGEASEVVLLIMSQKGVDAMTSTEFKLGADIGVAAGPVGAGAAAQTTDVLVFSRTKGGLYGGLNLEGAIIKPRHEWNNQYYAAQVNRPSDIIIQRKVENPRADPLRQTVASVARR